MTHSDPQKPGWISAAQRLRKVRGACLTFLDRWAVAQLLSDNPALDRVAYDLASAEAEIADPKIRIGLSYIVAAFWTISK